MENYHYWFVVSSWASGSIQDCGVKFTDWGFLHCHLGLV